MYSKTQWIRKIGPSALLLVVAAAPLTAQVRMIPMQFKIVEAGEPDEARDMYNSGSDFFTQGKYDRAENAFRSVLKKYPKNPIADKSAYMLARTLVNLGKVKDALTQIDLLEKSYPKSAWLGDARELRVNLTGQLDPEVVARLASTAQSAPPVPPRAPQAPVAQAAPAAPTAPPAPAAPIATPFGVMNGNMPRIVGVVQGARPGVPDENPEVSFQREVLRVLFENNPDRALEIAGDRLKADPTDQVVLSNLYMVANSRSEKGLPLLVTIAKTSPTSKVRRDAIHWISQTRADKDALTDLLVSLIPSMTADEDSSAVASALGQINTPKAVDALAILARDKSKSDRMRTNAINSIANSRSANRTMLLEDIYKSLSDNPKLRRQVLSYFANSKDPQSVNILVGIANTDSDLTVRRDAVNYLGQIKTPEALKALEALLSKKPQ